MSHYHFNGESVPLARKLRKWVDFNVSDVVNSLGVPTPASYSLDTSTVMLDMHKHHTLYCVNWAYCINPSRVSIGATIKYWLIEIGHRRVVTADNPLLWVPGPGPPHIKGRADLNIGREFETLGRATKYSKSTGRSKVLKKKLLWDLVPDHPISNAEPIQTLDQYSNCFKQ